MYNIMHTIIRIQPNNALPPDPFQEMAAAGLDPNAVLQALIQVLRRRPGCYSML